MDLGSLHTGGSVMSDDKAYMSYEEYLENVKKGHCNEGRKLSCHAASCHVAGALEITAYVRDAFDK